jgi:hypothetical protein
MVAELGLHRSVSLFVCATKPYKFIGFGAMDVTTPYKFIRFGAMDVTKPYKFIRFGAMDFTDRMVTGGFKKPHGMTFPEIQKLLF